MDKFTKYALIAMVLTVAIMTVGGYVGYLVGGNEATDDYVNDKASANTAVYTVDNPFTIEPWGINGEYVGFFIAGALGGLLAGYLFPTAMSSSNIESKRRD